MLIIDAITGEVIETEIHRTKEESELKEEMKEELRLQLIEISEVTNYSENYNE